MTDRPAHAGVTPSQTVGPFFAFCLTPAAPYAFTGFCGGDLVTHDAAGPVLRIAGRVFDGAGAPVPDAMIETWQADGNGRYPAGGRPNGAFTGFGRVATGPDGSFAFRTVRPGRLPGPGGVLQAPHLDLALFSRGLLRHLVTRLYFAGDATNAADPVLALVPAGRRPTLLARPDGEAEGEPLWRFDIRLQGEAETVFFAA